MIILAIPVLLASGLIFAEISIMFVAIIPGIDSFNYFYTLLMTPMFLFSGICRPSLSPREHLQGIGVNGISCFCGGRATAVSRSAVAGAVSFPPDAEADREMTNIFGRL
jgi:hypothetical protein